MSEMHHPIEDEILKHLEPIPVRIVKEMHEETRDVAKSWYPQNKLIPAIGQPQQIVGVNPKRKRVIMFTDAGNTGVVNISAKNNGQPFISIAAGSSPIVMEHQDAVYAVPNGTSVATLYVWEEVY